jgi:hypothetical protein
MDSYFDTGAIAKRTKQGLTYYTAAKRSNAINNVGQGYSWAVEAKNSATSAADPYALKSFEELWTMVTPESINDMGTILQTLIDAYLYTDDEKYGKAGLVLLDRIADLYPNVEFIGTEKECATEQILAKAYDAFYPIVGNTEVIDFLSGKAAALGLVNDKSYADKICVNIEDNIIRTIRDLSERPEMMDNYGMQQAALSIYFQGRQCGRWKGYRRRYIAIAGK